jgi:hypothetical protein
MENLIYEDEIVDENIVETIYKEKDINSKHVKEMISKWKDMLNNVEESEHYVLAILLEGMDCLMNVKSYKHIFTKEQVLWLVKEIWLRCRFKKLIRVQPMLGPTSVVFYNNNNNILTHAGVAARVIKYKSVLFYENANFELMRDIYADQMAIEIDMMIASHLGEVDIDLILNAIDSGYIDEIQSIYDYLILPQTYIDGLKEHNISIDLFKIHDIIDPESLHLCVYGGKYKDALSLPIFAPYILFAETPGWYDTRGAFLRAGWFDGK